MTSLNLYLSKLSETTVKSIIVTMDTPILFLETYHQKMPQHTQNCETGNAETAQNGYSQK